MALVNLTTNLKSLRYGKDTVGGGNSNQPYVKTSIPEDLSDVGRTGGPDFLLRGGTLLPKIVVNDVSRMTKMFFDFKSPRGPLFIAKQNLLSLTNVSSQVGYKEFKESNTPPPEGTSIGNLLRSLVPPLNQGIYLPLSTIGQAAGNAIGLHLDKQGLGFNFKTTIGSPDGNSLLGLPTYLNTIHTNATDGPKSRLFGLLDKVNTNTQGVNDLYSYSGGPGATLGVGKTNIVMVGDQRTGINNPNTTREKPKVTWGSVTRFNTFANQFDVNNFGSSPLSPANQIGSGGKTSYTIGDINISPTVNDENLSNAIINDQFLRVGASAAYLGNSFILQNANTSIKNAFLGNGKVQTFSVYEQNDDPFSLSTKNNGKAFNSGVLDRTPQLQLSQEQISSKEPFSKTGNQNNITNFTKEIAPSGSQFIPKTIDYNTKGRIEQRVSLGDPGKRANRISYTIGRQELGQDLTVSQNSGYDKALDKINAFPIYQSKLVTDNKIKNDLVKFRIGVISNTDPSLKTYIHFRAFINSFEDNFTADWKGTNYMGRGEKFYKYGGFDRKISMGWTVAAQSKQELIPMWQKLNYLASVTAPDYSSTGYMSGNLITLTVGGYLYEQVGIMTGLNLSVPDESPWDIAISDTPTATRDASVKEMPMICNVSGFNFIPIHNFVPKVQSNDYDGLNVGTRGGKFVSKYGQEQYIALSQTSTDGTSLVNNYGGDDKNINYIPK